MAFPDQTVLDKARRVQDAYLIVGTDILQPLDLLIEGGGLLPELTRDARASLASIIDAASIPFTLTCAYVQDARFTSFLSAERIRGLKEPDNDGNIDEGAALGRARSIMNEFVRSGEGTDWLRDRVLSSLGRGLDTEDVVNASRELLQQALVGTWGVFEVFVSSLIVNVLNSNPQAASKLLGSERGRKHFAKPTVSVEALEAHGFDATRSMGSILFEGKRLDSLSMLKDMVSGILADDAVDQALQSKELYLLNQRRHLVVHKRGIVDRDYVQRTGEIIELGSKLPIKSPDIESYIVTVCSLIKTLTASHGLRSAMA